ncbi:MAG: IS630 family transposase [Chitinophagales bacterium]
MPYTSISGLHHVLREFGISYQRARPYIHSPDREYKQKEAFLHQILQNRIPIQEEVLFQDEFTFYAEASLAKDFAPIGRQPLQRWAYKNKDKRICATMNAFTGEVHAMIAPKIGIDAFVEFLQQLQEQYPKAQTIYMVVDNCPVHFHPDVQATLQEQIHDFELHLPSSWRNVQPKEKFKQLDLNVQMVPLPTYASWLNPIEKLWKLLNQEVIHLHRIPNHFKELVGKVQEWFEQFENASDRLLSFCGLKKPNSIFAKDIIINRNRSG